MSFSPARRHISIRLTVWYAGIFLGTWALLFVVSYAWISAVFEKEDRDELRRKFKSYAGAYEESDLSGLQDVINGERDFGKPVPYLVRVVDVQNVTLFLSLPDQWSRTDNLGVMASIPTREGYHRVRISTAQDGAVYEIGAYPLDDGNVLQIGKDVTHREELLLQFRRVFFGVFLPSIMIALAGGFFLTFRALKPVRELTAVMQDIAATRNLQMRVPVNAAGDELAELVRLFNAMQDRIEQLVKGMQESLDNIAHDLRTPVTRLRMSAEQALRSGGMNDCREALSDCLEEAERIMKTLTALMDIAEAESGAQTIVCKEIRLSRLVETIADLYRHIAEEKGVALHVHVPDAITLETDEGKVQQVLANLIDNAIKYTASGGSVSVDATTAGPDVIVTVRDTGAGIPETELSSIWERLYRGDKSRTERGFGLGLSIVRSFVKALGGEVVVESAQGEGTAFAVRLPRNQRQIPL